MNHERTALQQQLCDDYARLQATNHLDRVSGLADLQDHIRTAERRLTEIDNELIALRDQTLDESVVAAALAEFDQLWEALAPREQARVLELLVARVDHDGQRGKVSLTLQPTGIQSLTQEIAHHQEHVA